MTLTQEGIYLPPVEKNVAFRQVRAGTAAPAHHLGPELSLSHPDGDWCLASVKFSL